LTAFPIVCAACEFSEPDIVSIGGLQRTSCRCCGHSQRLDIQPFDYRSFAMGQTGLAQQRLETQASFIMSHLSEGARVLEVGCAAGDLARELRRHGSFSSYHGVEISPARQRATKVLDRVFAKPLEALLDAGEIQETDYDIVLSSHHLEHIEQPFATIQTMTRAMKPRGLLFLETPNRSGHALLPFDDNRAHIHFFCASSLTRLLSRCGLETMSLETGVRHDARYQDCLRVMARFAAGVSELHGSLLSHAAELEGLSDLVVWGAGRMVDEMLAHYFDPSQIAFFVDNDTRKHGGIRLGAPVCSPDVLEKGSNWCVLVNSIEMENSIRQEISTRFGARVGRVIGVSELLDRLGRC